MMLLTLNMCVANSVAAGQYDPYLIRIPEDANTLILLNVESIFSSPLAKSENWQQTYADNFAGTPLIVPPNAQRFALGAAIDIETMEPLWEVASMGLSVDPTIQVVADRIGGVRDQLSGVEALWPRENLCIIKFAPAEFAVLSPATRQSAARWARHAQQHLEVELSPYLMQAARYAENSGPEIMMAIDLDQILRPEAIQAAVQRSSLLRTLDRDQVTQVLSSLRGLMLGVRVTDRIYGKLLVDFGQDASVLEPIAKDLVIQVLTTTGAMIEEFNDWQVKVQGPRVSIEGPLSTPGMRRLFSVVTLDAAVIARKKDVASPPPAAQATEPKDKKSAEQELQNVMANASYRYFRSIDRYLNDLQRPRRSNDLSDIALWINNFARKIERLPSYNVDPDLQAYGQTVVYGMRDAVAHLHGIDERTAERQAQVRPESNVTIGTVPTGRVVQWGPYYRFREYVPFAKANIDIGSSLSEQDRIAQEEYEAGTDAALQIMEHLKSETQNVRQVMSQRYGREF